MELLQQLFCYKIDSSDSAEIVAKKHQRQKEHDDCFRHNISLPFITTHHVFLERADDAAYLQALISEEYIPKIRFIPLERQALYSDYIEYIRKTIPPAHVCCIMNGDLFIDQAFNFRVIDKYLTPDVAFGLTRHEYTDTAHSICNVSTCSLIYRYAGSHDTFLLRTPLLPDINISAISHRQNLFGAENVFHAVLAKAGYKFLNPCIQLRTFHNHKDAVYFEQYKRINRPGEYYGERPSILKLS